MQVTQKPYETTRLLTDATSLQLAFQQVKGDLCFFPFSDDETAQILGVRISDLPFLHEHSILERTCLPTECGLLADPACSYWDMLNANICMSLLAAGVSIPDAHEIAFRLFDVIAENGEHETNAGMLDYNKLMAHVEELLTESGSGFDLRRSPHPVQAMAKKVAIDLLHMHQRCAGVRSSESGWHQ